MRPVSVILLLNSAICALMYTFGSQSYNLYRSIFNIYFIIHIGYSNLLDHLLEISWEYNIILQVNLGTLSCEYKSVLLKVERILLICRMKSRLLYSFLSFFNQMTISIEINIASNNIYKTE